MKKIMFLTLACILAFPISAMCQCVPENEALQSWKSLYDQLPITSGVVVTTLACDPCTCMTSTAACYEYMAQQEREKERYRMEERERLDRALKFGICK